MTKNASALRNYSIEKSAGRGNLALRMVEVKEARYEASTMELMLIAQIMVFCGLPYRRNTDRRIVRKARTGKGSTVTVTFQAMVDGVDIPFGSDRTLLHWVTHHALVTRSPFVPLSSASQFLRDMGMSTSGQNIQRVKEAFRRIASVAIVVQRDDDKSVNTQQIIMPIARSAALPKRLRKKPAPEQISLLPDGPDEREESPFDEPAGFRLDDAVFREFSQFHVPTLRKLLEVTRESPQIQDYMMFLQWRSFSAREESLIPWAQMREQMCQDDSNPYRMRARFQEAIEALRIAWPALNATAETKGLRIGPPSRGEQFLIDGAQRKRALS
ncbi:RepA protein [Granulicella rosea]|uniref:RepA protein n=1 Tax=Granulicella rosea TaxID=474952 RepID=A0A239M6D1_9BACT|nr:replication protein RepA [Granulicella rosea]SNT38266.1 RepA protein [Granulicella rosea]